MSSVHLHFHYATVSCDSLTTGGDGEILACRRAGAQTNSAAAARAPRRAADDLSSLPTSSELGFKETLTKRLRLLTD
jgi:hypothetical protein